MSSELLFANSFGRNMAENLQRDSDYLLVKKLVVFLAVKYYIFFRR